MHKEKYYMRKYIAAPSSLSHVGDHPKMPLRKLSKTGSVFRHLVNYPLRTK